jgi:hypothetical protein
MAWQRLSNQGARQAPRLKLAAFVVAKAGKTADFMLPEKDSTASLASVAMGVNVRPKLNNKKFA